MRLGGFASQKKSTGHIGAGGGSVQVCCHSGETRVHGKEREKAGSSG